MVPRAPVPHCTHRAVQPRPGLFGRAFERVAAVAISPMLVLFALAAVVLSQLHITTTRPGVNFATTTARRQRQDPTDTGAAFWAILAERGAINTPIEVNDLDGYTRAFGDRDTGGWGYDGVDVFNREGGSRVVLVRAAGPNPVKAKHTFVDRAGSPLSTIDVVAKDEGAWGNSLTAAISNGVGSNTFVITVKRNSVIVETSFDLASPTDAVAWASEFSDYVNVVDKASATAAPSNNPAVVADTALTGGTDDRGNITETQWLAALTAMGKDLGPGQVAIPGRTTDTCHLNLVAHADTHNRVAFCDLVDTATFATLDTAADAVRAGTPTPRVGASFAPWITCPGVVNGTTRTMPPSIVACALAARGDKATGHANQAPAGTHDNNAGVLRYCAGVTQSWADADRQTLNEHGVNVFIFDRPLNQVELYGWRTLVDPNEDPEWVQLSSARFRMQLEAEWTAIGRKFLFSTLDGQGKTIGAFHGQIVGNCLGHYSQGALYGATPAEAYEIVTDTPVNTTVTAADGELNVQGAVHMSPFAEQVNEVLVKVPLTDALGG